MANRGVCLLDTIGLRIGDGTVPLNWTYRGFSDEFERCAGTMYIDSSITSGLALKAAVKDLVTDWYANNPGSWASWNGLLDNFILINGIL